MNPAKRRPVTVTAVDLLVRVLIAGAAFAGTGLLVTRWPRLLLGRGPVPVAVLSVAAAAGALAADGAPTALGAVDVALRAALAAMVTAASARARRQVWLFASTATVVAGTGAAYDWLAFVADRAPPWPCWSWAGGAGSWAPSSAPACRRYSFASTSAGRPAPARRRRRRRRAARRLRAAPRPALHPPASLDHRRRPGRRRRGVQRRRQRWPPPGPPATSGQGIDAGRDGLAAARQGDVPEATARFDHAADGFGRAGADLRPLVGPPGAGRAGRRPAAAGGTDPQRSRRGPRRRRLVARRRSST